MFVVHCVLTRANGRHVIARDATPIAVCAETTRDARRVNPAPSSLCSTSLALSFIILCGAGWKERRLFLPVLFTPVCTLVYVVNIAGESTNRTSFCFQAMQV